MSVRSRTALLVIVHLGVWLVFWNCVIRLPYDRFLELLILFIRPILAAQPILLAIWITLSGGGRPWRVMPVALAFAAAVLLQSYWEFPDARYLCLGQVNSSLFEVFGCTLGMFAARWVGVTVASEKHASAGQLGLGTLLLWVATAAVVMAVVSGSVRMVASTDGQFAWNAAIWSIELKNYAMLTAAGCLALWLALCSQSTPVRCLVGALLVVLAVCGPIRGERLFQSDHSAGYLAYEVGRITGAAVVVALSLLLYRSAGVRAQWRRPWRRAAQETSNTVDSP